MPSLLLCSASPRRRELLAQLGLSFTAVAPQLDERRLPGEAPSALAERLARQKALAGLELHRMRAPETHAGELLVALAADTVVAVGDEDLGKPKDLADAERMLRALSGRVHTVITSVCVAGPAQGALRTRTVATEVKFRVLTEAEIEWHAASGEGADKAGGYALQGLAGAFVERIDGSVSGVVGLPLVEALGLLAEAGIALPWASPAKADT